METCCDNDIKLEGPHLGRLWAKVGDDKIEVFSGWKRATYGLVSMRALARRKWCVGHLRCFVLFATIEEKRHTQRVPVNQEEPHSIL